MRGRCIDDNGFGEGLVTLGKVYELRPYGGDPASWAVDADDGKTWGLDKKRFEIVAEDPTPAPAEAETIVHSTLPVAGTKPERKPVLPADKQSRKDTPIARGVLDYFPLAVAEIARVSKKGNEQHNPGQEMHWARGKSTDHADCIVRHLIDRGTIDDDGLRHTAKVAWRALALLQTELEEEGAAQ